MTNMRRQYDLDHRLIRAPLAIVGRSRSGTRILAELLQRAGVFMGADVDRGFLDSISWYQRFAVPLLVCDGSLGHADRPLRKEWESFVDERLQDTLQRHLPQGPVAPWGWKYPETLFLMTVIKARLSGAMFVHVIRDGRDVVVSNGGHFHLTFFSLGNPPGWRPPPVPAGLRPAASAKEQGFRIPSFREFCRSVTFGDSSTSCWRGIDLSDPAQLAENKFLIQMQSWKRSVEWARTCATALEGAYHEIRYERLCLDPLDESARLFHLLGIELSRDARAYLADEVRPFGIGRWRKYRFTSAERRDFAAACELGQTLLQDLGYHDG